MKEILKRAVRRATFPPPPCLSLGIRNEKRHVRTLCAFLTKYPVVKISDHGPLGSLLSLGYR